MSNVWQYYLLKFVSRLVCLLPYRLVLVVGKALGKVYYHIVARQRQCSLETMQRGLGLSPDQADAIVHRLFGKLGQTFLELLFFPAMTPDRMKEIVVIENEHYLQEAIAQGRGVVFLTAHMGNWEWLGASLAMRGFPITSFIKRQPNDQHNRILNEYRQKAGIEVYTRGTSDTIGAARALKQGKVLGFIADQDGGDDGIFVNFLGKMASTPRGAAFFAKKFKAPILPAFIVRREEGGHRIIIEPPFYFEDTGNEAEDIYNSTVRMTQIIENMIRRYPDEWLWFQKRWNTPFAPSSSNEQKAGEAI